MNQRYFCSVFTGIAVLACVCAAQAVPLGTAFSYQGQLKKAGVPVSASCPGSTCCNMTFRLYDAATLGNQKGSTFGPVAIGVVNGLFSQALDFGPNAINGDARWLEIRVQCGADPLTTLSPRQELKPVPHAIRAGKGVGPRTRSRLIRPQATSGLG